MPFGEFLKKETAREIKIIRKCHYCGKELENDGSYLYYQGFCYEGCKQKYIDEGK